MRSRDVTRLTLLRSATQQNDNRLAIFAEVHPIPGTEIDPKLEYASADALHAREVSQLQPANGRRNLRCRGGIKSAKPIRERAQSRTIEVFENGQSANGNINVTIRN